MKPIDQLRMCGYQGPDELDPAIVTEIERVANLPRPGRAVKRGHSARRRLLRMLGMKTWPGLYVLLAVARGEDYVSPSRAGVVLYRATGFGGFGGDADAYHAEQVWCG